MTKNEEVKFVIAEPIWPKGKEEEMNITVGFRGEFKNIKGEKLILRIAAASLYRFYINGEFIGHGPARGPHGYYRVDEWVIDKRVIKDINILAIEVVGYNVNSFYLLDQPSFLQAELVNDNVIILATKGSNSNFQAHMIKERIQKVQRYSFQRPFIEAYRLSEGFDKWRVDVNIPLKTIECSCVGNKSLISRNVSYSEFKKQFPLYEVERGIFTANNLDNVLWEDRALRDIGPKLKGYREDELEVILSREIDRTLTLSKETLNCQYDKNSVITFSDKNYEIIDFGINYTGFIGMKVNCKKDVRLVLTFDEVLIEGEIDYKRSDCTNGIRYELRGGEYELESFEPYTLKYLKIMVFEGECEINGIYLRELTNPEDFKAEFKCSSKELNEIFEAGRQTFRQNALDIYMDCPSRERAGWLCDSFFTSRVEYDLTGKNIIEDNFLENYLLPDSFKYIPKGMFPMCYPADHYDGVFIPNWSLWLIIELEEYLERSNNREVIDAFKPKIMALFNYFNKFKNEYGLLEKLEGWIFVEWSKANDFMMDVNYPTNMLYAAALKTAGRIYGEKALIDEGDKLHEIIRKNSFNGEFFVDNAVRENGKLEPTMNTTEVCQYYAFIFGTATLENHSVLFDTLVKKFGPTRKSKEIYPKVYGANAFIGNYLRMELLSQKGYVQQLINETKAFFYYMVQGTGTLWEHTGAYASCNHGFASHVIHCYYRDVLGIWKLDQKMKKLILRFTDLNLDWCEGRLPVEGGSIDVKWKFENGEIRYKYDVPKDYTVEIINISNRKIKQL